MTSTRHLSQASNSGSGSATNGEGTTAATSSHRVRRLYQIHVGQLFDSVGRVLVKDQVVTVDRNRGVIVDISDERSQGWQWIIEKEEADLVVERINLEGLVLLPGFVDVHVHCEYL